MRVRTTPVGHHTLSPDSHLPGFDSLPGVDSTG